MLGRLAKRALAEAVLSFVASAASKAGEMIVEHRLAKYQIRQAEIEEEKAVRRKTRKK